MLSAFDKMIKYSEVKQIILSYEFPQKLTHFIEVPGVECDDQMVQKINRTDIIICYQNSLVTVKLDNSQEDYLFSTPFDV